MFTLFLGAVTLLILSINMPLPESPLIPFSSYNSTFRLSPELLDSLSGYILQLMEEVDEAEFSATVMQLLERFDGKGAFHYSTVLKISESLDRFRTQIGNGPYWLLCSILSYHQQEPEKLANWFSRFAGDNEAVNEYFLYQVMNGISLN